MTDADETPFFEKEPPQPLSPRKRSAGGTVLLIVLMFFVAVGMGILAAPFLSPFGLGSRNGIPAAVLAEQDVSTAALARLGALEGRVKTLEALPREPVSAPQGAESADFPALKEGVARLASSLELLQGEIGRTAHKTDALSARAESGLAATLAFVQMHAAAYAGRPFEAERQVLRETLAQDPQAMALLDRMEGTAISGASGLDLLLGRFTALAPAAQSAMRKAAAQTWMDRLVVALESLVSIRRLGAGDAGEPFSISAVVLDLSKGDLRAAVQKTDAYPAEAKELLQDWRKEAAKRLELEADFKALSSHLIARLGEGAQASSAPAPALAPVAQEAPSAQQDSAP